MPATAVERYDYGFCHYIPDLNTPRFQVAKEQDAYSYAETSNTEYRPLWLYNLCQTWQRLFEEPYKGVTTNGLNLSAESTRPAGSRKRHT